jgi:hypothetical protein
VDDKVMLGSGHKRDYDAGEWENTASAQAS